MKKITSFTENLTFDRALALSVAGHLALFIVVAVRAVFYPSTPVELERAIRVDMVALPTKQAELPPLEPAASPKPEVKTLDTPPPPASPVSVDKKLVPKTDPTKVNLQKVKNDQNAALKRLEAMSKIEKMLQQKSQKSSAEKADGKPTAPVKGNEISKGSSLTGIAKLDHDDYLGVFENQVRKHWSLPSWLSNMKLNAKVAVYVNEQGVVIKREITKSSGNSVFDERVLRAVDDAAPFPPPPSRLASIFMIDGVVLGFPE